MIFFIDFDGFWWIFDGYFDILGFLVIWEKMCSVGFSLVFEFLFCWGVLLGRDSFLFGIFEDLGKCAVLAFHLSLSFNFAGEFC